MALNVLYEDAWILVAVKPAGMPSQRDRSGDLAMITAVGEYLKKDSGKPYVGLIHRLDRPVSGVMVFAKTPAANAKLSEQLRQQDFDKMYYAVVNGNPQKDEDELTDSLVKRHEGFSEVVTAGTDGAKEARLTYKVVGRLNHETEGELALLQVHLMTGRHHQIRVQLAHAGLPIWGDTKYNAGFNKRESAGRDGWFNIGLCACQLSFKHPRSMTDKTFQIKPEGYPFELFQI